MNHILNNPYRILGLLVGSKAAQQNRQVTRLKKFIEAEQEPESDFSFPVLGSINRSVVFIDLAASQITLDTEKMSASLFWFYIGSPITDEPAFEKLADGNYEEAGAIWSKLTSKHDVTSRNASAFWNLSTLYLSKYQNKTILVDEFELGLKLKLKFLESEYWHLLKEQATDATFKISKVELQLLFLKNVCLEIAKHDDLYFDNLLEIVSQEEFEAKEEFLKSIVQKPIAEIEKQINASKSKRKASKAVALKYGEKLYLETAEKLKIISTLLGRSNVKYISISDKVSDEILQCGIDYFSHYRDSATDPGPEVIKLFNAAKSRALGNIAKQRCAENTENLQAWIDDKPMREKQTLVTADLKLLKNLIDAFEDRQSSNIGSAEAILKEAKNSLSNLKRILGANDELYLVISTRIAGIAQGMCVFEINRLQQTIDKTLDQVTKIVLILNLKEKVDQAWQVVISIENMDLSDEFRSHYSSNRSSLNGLKTQLAGIKTPSSSSSGGCYIATMAYGDYDHPQVKILREFRDEKLSKSAFGRWFIRIYYHYSPKLVVKLKDSTGINKLIRTTLNLIVKLIK